MPVPKNKNELIKQCNDNYVALNQLIETFSNEEQKIEFPKGTLNRNIRDVIAHLYHWHLLFLSWYKEGMKGKKTNIPAKGYTWKTTKELNCKIWEKYQEMPLEKAKKLLKRTHNKLQQVIKNHSDVELFEKKIYPWTGTTSLAVYLRGSTSSHYYWAYKLIKKAKKQF